MGVEVQAGAPTLCTVVGGPGEEAAVQDPEGQREGKEKGGEGRDHPPSLQEGGPGRPQHTPAPRAAGARDPRVPWGWQGPALAHCPSTEARATPTSPAALGGEKRVHVLKVSDCTCEESYESQFRKKC